MRLAKIFLAAAFVSLQAFSSAAQAYEVNYRLTGAYQFSTQKTCLQNQTGFSASMQALTPATPSNQTLESVHTYDGAGHVKIEGRTLTIGTATVPQGSIAVGGSNYSCTGTYSLQDNNNLTETVTCSGTLLYDSASPPSTYTSSAVTITGKVRSGVIVTKNTAPTVGTVTYSNGSTFYRVCSLSGTGVRE